MKRNFLAAIVISVGIASCATKPVEVDNTPLNPTAVIERQVINNGIKGFFPYASTERIYVRANMRRDESTFKGTGTYSGYLVGTRSGTKIARVDRNLLWALNTEKQVYTECPLTGCVESAKRPADQPKDAQPPEAQHESGCTMRVAHTSFTVKATGQKKTINGFDTDEYQVAWVIKLHDKAARNTTSTLNIDIWTTPLTPAIRETLGIEEAYARAFAGTVADPDKQKVFPTEAAKLMSAYLANTLSPADRNAFLDAGRQMEKVKGYPISTHLIWNMEGNACESKDAKEKEAKSSQGQSMPHSAGGLASGLFGMLVEKKTDEAVKESESEPLFSFIVEVKSLKTEPLHDSVFTVPKNYSLVPKL